jgi:hypothetical protein
MMRVRCLTLEPIKFAEDTFSLGLWYACSPIGNAYQYLLFLFFYSYF